jgi:hypothetical protein
VASKRPVTLAISSDQHCGSTLGLCPPEGVRLDGDASYQPSRAQRWTWECWEDYWKTVAKIRAQHGGELWTVYNGDAVDGDHHNTSQIISKNPEPQAYLLDRVFSVPLALAPERQVVIRGTEAHVGPAGASEEMWAKHLKNHVRDPETRAHSWWHFRPEVHGVLFDFQHHGRIGTRPWTKLSGVGTLAAEIMIECADSGEAIPNYAIRSHRHIYADTGDNYRTRLIQTPAFQLKTAHAHKVAPESIAHIGGIIITVFPDGTSDVRKKLYRHSLPKVWRAA